MNLNKTILIFVINFIALNGEKIPQTNDNCGAIYEDMLYNGETIAKTKEYPWTVLIGYGRRDDWAGIEYKCQGALLSRRIVITANHCTKFPGPNISEILVGDWGADVQVDQRTYAYGVDEYIGNPDFDQNFGLLHLAREVIFGPYVQPICLPPTEYTHDNIVTKQLFFTGMERRATPGQYQFFKYKKSAQILSPLYCARNYFSFIERDKHLCGLNEESTNLVSGASLMDVKTINSEPKYMFLVGIATVGTLKDSNFVVLFSSIIPHVGWIKRYIRLAD